MRSTSERWLVASAIAVLTAALALAVADGPPGIGRAYAVRLAAEESAPAEPEAPQPPEDVEPPGDEGAASEGFPVTEPPTVVPPEETVPPEVTTPPEPTVPPEPTTPPEPTAPPETTSPPTSPPPVTHTPEATETSPTLPGFETTLPFTGGNPVGFVVGGGALMLLGAGLIGYGPIVRALGR